MTDIDPQDTIDSLTQQLGDANDDIDLLTDKLGDANDKIEKMERAFSVILDLAREWS